MEKYGKEEWWKGNGDINDGYIVNKNSKKLEELKNGHGLIYIHSFLHQELI